MRLQTICSADTEVAIGKREMPLDGRPVETEVAIGRENCRNWNCLRKGDPAETGIHEKLNGRGGRQLM